MENVLQKVHATLNGKIILTVLERMEVALVDGIELDHDMISAVQADDNVVGELDLFETVCLQLACEMGDAHNKAHEQGDTNALDCLKFRKELEWLVASVDTSVRTRVPELVDDRSVRPVYRKGGKIVMEPISHRGLSILEIITMAPAF